MLLNSRPLLFALCYGLLLSLLTACGGSQPSGADEKTGVVFEPASSGDHAGEAPPASEETALARAASLNTASLEAAEQRAKAAEARTSSTDLDKLQPGQIAPKSAYASGDIARKALAVGITAYRFYNTRSGAHFYTVSEAERDNVRNNLSPPFNYEGDAFRVASLYAPGLSPVHRFYNTQNGVHFYTISEAERAHVAANLKHYTYEGVAYHASEVAGANLIPFHRFYVPSKGFHFYTASEEEKNNIIANLGAVYRYEGVGYHVLDTLWNAEKLPHTGASSCYVAGSIFLVQCDEAAAALNPLQDGFLTHKNPMAYDFVRNPATGGNFELTECVVDKVTGLIWEGKLSGAGTSPRNVYDQFTNLGNGAVNDASGYVTAVNASRLCGYSDWRLPSVVELQSTLQYLNNAQTSLLDPNWFYVNATSRATDPHATYWSSNRQGNSGLGWYVATANQDSLGPFGGWTAVGELIQARLVRLVRGAPMGGTGPRFTFSTIPYGINAANNVVNDAWTGLQWRRCAEGLAWNGTTCVGSFGVFTHEAALSHARQQAGWRMPNVKELASLAELTNGGGADPLAFPASPNYELWTSTPVRKQGENKAWFVSSRGVNYAARTTPLALRLLRAN